MRTLDAIFAALCVAAVACDHAILARRRAGAARGRCSGRGSRRASGLGGRLGLPALRPACTRRYAVRRFRACATAEIKAVAREAEGRASAHLSVCAARALHAPVAIRAAWSFSAVCLTLLAPGCRSSSWSSSGRQCRRRCRLRRRLRAAFAAMAERRAAAPCSWRRVDLALQSIGTPVVPTARAVHVAQLTERPLLLADTPYR